MINTEIHQVSNSQPIWNEIHFDFEQPKDFNSIITCAVIETEDYIGKIEISYLSKENKFNILGIIQLNYFNQLPKWTIFHENLSFETWTDTLLHYLNLKEKIFDFMK